MFNTGMWTFSIILICISPVLTYLVGGDGNLGLILAKYPRDFSAIQCTDKRILKAGCRDVMTGIPVAGQKLLFGPNRPPADVLLPAKTMSCEFFFSFKGTRLMIVDNRRCTMRVWTMNHDGDMTSWYQLWEAANALFFKCVNHGRQGTFRGLGRLLASRRALRRQMLI